MNGFLALETAQDDDPETPETESIIENDGWFPDIDIKNFRDVMRMDGTVIHGRAKEALIAGIIFVNNVLQAWSGQQLEDGHNKLQDVPAPSVNKESVHVYNYRRAVYCWAKADLIERYRDYDVTGEGHKKAEWLEDSPGDQRRNAHWAISDILGKARMTVDLI